MLLARWFARSSSDRNARCSPGEDAYRFRHLLIRDAAYDASPNTSGPTCTRHSPWLERVAGDRVIEQEEIHGYHLEQAYQLRGELGLGRRTGWRSPAGLRALGSAGQPKLRTG